MDWAQILREFGLPTLFCTWLMWLHTKAHRDLRDELREMRVLLHKQVVLSAVIAKTLDVEDNPSLPPSPAATPPEGG